MSSVSASVFIIHLSLAELNSGRMFWGTGHSLMQSTGHLPEGVVTNTVFVGLCRNIGVLY